MKTLYMLMFGGQLFLALLASSAASSGLPERPPLGRDQARHLLARTGFDIQPAEIERLSALDATHAARSLIGSSQSKGVVPPQWTADWERPPGREVPREQRQERRRLDKKRTQELKAWWYQQMLYTTAPLSERMVLFWHGHFTTSVAKVGIPQLIYRQNAALRRHALGNFGVMLGEISRDPAMLRYLDGARNVAGRANENYAREVMELFSLGEGHFTESDVREAARAFTGWAVNLKTGEFVRRPGQHDSGPKTIFGETGNFDGDDVIRLLLTRPETSEFIVAKLWKEFVSPVPDRDEVVRLGRLFRDGNYEIKPLLLAIFTSPAFYAEQHQAQLVKSPVELIVGTLRQFNLSPQDWQPIINTARQMGQDLFTPPNVKGWPGGDWWINSQTLAVRQRFMSRLLRGDAKGAGGVLEVDYAAWLATCDVQCTVHTLLPETPPTLPAGSAAQILRRTLSDPRYQLK
jgi:uncharacterized protein (DUF1800 family)